MNIISLQSAVAYGHVGNSAAVFAMQRLGCEVWPVYTVNFSNHTEYPSWRGPVMTPEQVADVLDGMSFAFDQVGVILTGYLGSSELAAVVEDAVRRVKAANPNARYVCDPVIGNAQVGSFVAPEIPDVFRERLIPLADAITPNQWELSLLTGTELTTPEATAEAARSLKDHALVTSIGSHADATLGMLDITPEESLLVETPRLGGNVVGAGDLATALYTALQPKPAGERLSHIAGTMFDMVSEVRDRDLDELPLIEQQELIVEPRSKFQPRRI
ncbi:pyridoxal kinase [Corynebacterium aquatimens]|uniref:pyridoxal kinase n=1 Tax=Corynebacterium TaxID=1716 RepID=UPI001F1805F0|nr:MULTISPECIES: pyridoxal kinase [Corynebacterium]QYH19387.1 pyridoxal kinase [Corynebacterium aquatimens]UIZ91697.1 pyridoxal kinase [Corynebacterium sp. CNCTC7651]